MVRALEPADLPAAAALLARSWARTYLDTIAPDQQPTAEEHEAHLTSIDSRGWVFDLDGQVAAVALVTELSSDDPELSAFHVDPPAQGAGVGTQLHAHLLDELKAEGHTRLHLWVFDENLHARAFYEARGWGEAGTQADRPERCSIAPATRLDRTL